MHRLRFRIEPLFAENEQYVEKTIRENPEWYGKFNYHEVICPQFFQVTKEEEIIGFFSIIYWTHGEAVLCYLYVAPEYRKQGVFNKIIKYAKKHVPRRYFITINAMKNNARANEIYKHKFKYIRYDEKEDIEWYIIRSAK